MAIPKTLNAILSEADTYLADNTQRLVTPENMRTRVKDIATAALTGKQVNLTDYLDTGTDIDTAWASAFAAADVVRLPAGTWSASSLTLAAGKTLLTDGTKTIIQQKTSQAIGTRIIKVTGSNTRIGDLTLRGNISTDTDEQNHGIHVRGSADITDVKIGNIIGENIRGDVVYVGGLTSAGVSNFSIGDVYGSNVLRNVVSVTGVNHGRFGHVSGINVGYMVFDAEPNVGTSQKIKFVDVKSIRGGHAAIIGQSATDFIEFVTIGFLDLDPAYTPNSTPNYSHFSDASIAGIGFLTRNCRGVYVRQFRARDFINHAMKYEFNGGEMVGDDISIDYIDWENCNTGETTYNTQAQILNTNKVRFGGGRVVLPAGAGKRLYASSLTNVDATRVTVSS